MARKIVLSKRAARNLETLLEYLEQEWSQKVKLNFIKKLDRSLLILTEKPESSQRSEKIPGLYRSVVTKQTTVYYRFDNRNIYIIMIFDTRQDPKKLRTPGK